MPATKLQTDLQEEELRRLWEKDRAIRDLEAKNAHRAKIQELSYKLMIDRPISEDEDKRLFYLESQIREVFTGHDAYKCEEFLEMMNTHAGHFCFEEIRFYRAAIRGRRALVQKTRP